METLPRPLNSTRKIYATLNCTPHSWAFLWNPNLVKPCNLQIKNAKAKSIPGTLNLNVDAYDNTFSRSQGIARRVCLPNSGLSPGSKLTESYNS